MTTVVLVDDHRVVRAGLRSALDAEPDLDVVGEAGSVAEATQLVRAERPQVVVCDVSLGDGNGIDLVRTLRRGDPAMGLVVLTMHGDDDVLFAAIDAGASSLVLKGAHLDELLTAVRRAAVTPDVFSAAGLGEAMRRRSSAPAPLLTKREAEVLTLLGRGVVGAPGGPAPLPVGVDREDPRRQGVRQARGHQPGPGDHGGRPTRTGQARLRPVAASAVRSTWCGWSG